MRKASHRLRSLIAFCLIFGCMVKQASARAGGAGGSASSSHSSSSGGSSSHSSGGGSSGDSNHDDSSGHAPNPELLMVLLTFFGVCCGLGIWSLWIVLRSDRTHAATDPDASWREAQTPSASENRAETHIRSITPDFNLNAFKDKAARAFVRIQEAWNAQDISSARPFISDGLYQRFSTQFQMMRLLQQLNRLSTIEIHRIAVIHSRLDGPYQVIETEITASMLDEFICKLDSSLDERGDAAFTEYWTFLRRAGRSNYDCDLTSLEGCPSCGAALPPSMGEICRCEHCQVMINSGEFDWVLCEISQERDSGITSTSRPMQSDFGKQLAKLRKESPDFSVALSEDKASNAMMQIFTALCTHQQERIRRFVTTECYQELIRSREDLPVAYSRLYLNDVKLLAIKRNAKRYQLRFDVHLTLQRALIRQRSLSLLDPQPQKRIVHLSMERDISAIPPAGALYQHQCPCCGGAIADTTDIQCPYCHSALNSPGYEWIVTYIHSDQEL